jgi:amidase
MTAELGEMDVRALQRALESGALSSAELVMALAERVAQVDHAGPRLNAVQVINPDALFLAESRDAERARGVVRGPLHGIPVLLKDNIGTRDKMPTTAGALALEGLGAPMEATLVRRLRQAGAIIFGKTHLTEWANFMTHHMPNGYSALGGQVQNPYGPGRFDVGGSSSGSAAAVAAGLAPLAVGTETSGSILNPASNNSVVGIKPTVGAVSRYGIIPIASSQDTAGPMARTVYDAAVLLDAMVGRDRHDPATERGQWTGRLADYAQPGRLDGRRVGVVRQTFYRPLDGWVHDRMSEAVQALTGLGADVVDPVPLAGVDDIRDLTVLFYEFRLNLDAYLGRLPAWAPVHSLSELIRFNRERPHLALRYGQTILEEAEALSGRLVEPAYWEARLRDIRVARGAIDGALQSQRLDALLFAGSAGAGVAAKAGYPSITVPGGYGPDGRPVGITFTGTAFAEPTLVRLAAALEAATGYRRPPALGETA